MLHAVHVCLNQYETVTFTFQNSWINVTELFYIRVLTTVHLSYIFLNTLVLRAGKHHGQSETAMSWSESLFHFPLSESLIPSISLSVCSLGLSLNGYWWQVTLKTILIYHFDSFVALNWTCKKSNSYSVSYYLPYFAVIFLRSY